MSKQIHIRIPEQLYEEFFRIYPARGERTKYLIEKIQEAVADARITKTLGKGDEPWIS